MTIALSDLALSDMALTDIAGGLAAEEVNEAGPTALLVLALLGLGIVLLARSMRTHLRRVPPSFDPPAPADPAAPAPPVVPAPPGSPAASTGDDSGEPRERP